ncbi:hypothetical protein [Bacillus dakarensis]|uniref:hypothetical protein n=1 Tax=Robertmurraya dakarensis TaxID=1926278 RepID=UPI00098103C4|nr:hypothetical protein [Bacillus dakarensis]
MGNPFHACASCVHFRAKKGKDGMQYKCSRLGYETKPNYVFDCWNPKEHVRKLMEKRMGGSDKE